MKFKKSGDGVLQIGDDVLIFDIETDGLNIETANMKWFGAFSFKDNNYYFYTYDELEAIQRLINDHKVVCGFNSNEFDIPICENNGFNSNEFDIPICENNGLNFDYKIRIDLLKVLFNHKYRRSNRENIIKVGGKILKNLLPNHKLKTIAETLKLSVMKGDIDYNIFKQSHWTKMEIQEILKYLYADVKITKEIFEYFYKEFLPMKEFMSLDDQRKYNWYRTSVGSYTYKVICHQAGIKEEYGEQGKRKQYEGGYVSTPANESFRGPIYCLDYNSAYPHAFMMGNLYSHDCKCCSDTEKWTGNEMFPVEGKYCTQTMGKIERVIKKFYKMRLDYKKDKDVREYTIKIIVNTMYGISGSEIFKNLFSLNTASDCTLMARQMIKHARNVFEKHGYELIYTDTDSVYLLDTFDDKDRMLQVRQIIVDDIKKNVPFPQETFGMGIDEEIKAMWFFRDEDNKFKKKNYIYITNDDKIKIKGLPIIKSNCSKLAIKVVNILKPQIIKNTDIKFSRKYIDDLIHKLLQEDITLIANFYKVKSLDQYKNESSIQAQISKAFGPGPHWLVPNKQVGKVGKQKKYCLPEEALKLNLYDLDLDKTMDTELSPFIKNWRHPLHLRRKQRAQDTYEHQQEKEQQTFFKSDLWDSEAVGHDISDQEFWENEVSFEK